MTEFRRPVFILVGADRYHVGDIVYTEDEQPGRALPTMLRALAAVIEQNQHDIDALSDLDKEAEDSLPADLRNQE